MILKIDNRRLATNSSLQVLYLFPFNLFIHVLYRKKEPLRVQDYLKTLFVPF